MGEFERMFEAVPVAERRLLAELWRDRERYVRWAESSLLLFPCVREKYHELPPQVKLQAKAAGVAADSRSNGPAIMSFLLAGGERPLRSKPGRGWHIHHIYDGQHPWPGRDVSAHAVKDEQLFSEAAGLVAVHPIFDAAADEYGWLAWMLRLEAFKRFGLDPDGVLREFVDRDGDPGTVAVALVPWVHELGETVLDPAPEEAPAVPQALAWRLAADLIARHPDDLRVLESHPGGGQGDSVALFKRTADQDEATEDWTNLLDMNKGWATTHLTPQTWHGPDGGFERFNWLDVFLAENFDLDVVVPCEMSMGLTPAAPAPLTDSSIGPAVIAAVLARHAVDGVGWLVQNGYGDAWGDEREALFTFFPDAAQLRSSAARGQDPFDLPSTRFWFLTGPVRRQGGAVPSPVLAMDVVAGLAWRQGDTQRHQLIELYRFSDLRLDRTVEFLLERDI